VSILALTEVTMGYGAGRQRSLALDNVTLAMPQGAFALVTGPSGAGKSTLLKLVLAIERPQSGSIQVAGRDIHRLSRASIPYLRRNVGAVFQDFKLLPEATPIENVCLALHVLGMPSREVKQRAHAVLRRVEIDPATRRPVRCLSGGEQQRVAIARALAGDPEILLADEPTGNLDPRLTREILDLLGEVRRRGATIVIATHDPAVCEHDEVTHWFELDAGRLVATRTRARLEVAGAVA
jgi:cell division transport system ATP-binding protein